MIDLTPASPDRAMHADSDVRPNREIPVAWHDHGGEHVERKRRETAPVGQLPWSTEPGRGAIRAPTPEFGDHDNNVGTKIPETLKL